MSLAARAAVAAGVVGGLLAAFHRVSGGVGLGDRNRGMVEAEGTHPLNPYRIYLVSLGVFEKVAVQYPTINDVAPKGGGPTTRGCQRPTAPTVGPASKPERWTTSERQ